MAGTRKQIDWEKIEADYRAGILSVREIAASQGITHGAINKRAKRDGWERDLTARIKAKADALVSKAEVSNLVSAEKAATEKQIVEANAEAIGNIRLSHRKDIARTKTLSLALLEELSAQTIDAGLYAQLGDMLRSEDDKGMDKLNDLYRKVVSTPSRIDSVKKLADTLKTLVGLEREAWGIGAGADDSMKPTANVYCGLPDHILEMIGK